MTRLISIPILAFFVALASDPATARDDPTPVGHVGPLATLTIASNSLGAAKLFYADGFGLTLEGPVPISAETHRLQARLWGISPDVRYSQYLFGRQGVAQAAKIRLLVFERAVPTVRSSWDPTVLGPYTIGFPNTRPEELDTHVRALGFGARNPMERTPFHNEDGRQWDVLETVFTGPDFVAAVGIARGAGSAPISPVDERGIGGPTYSMMVVSDLDRMARFLHDVLGYEIRNRRIQTSSGTHGSLNTPDGTELELARLTPPGATHGFFILCQFRNRPVTDTALPPRLPALGLTLYSFPVDHLDPVLARASRAGATELRGPMIVDSPPHGKVRHATFLAPNGVMFELFESAQGATP